MIAHFWSIKKTPIALIAIMAIGFYFFAYHLDRTDFLTLVLLYGGLFTCFYFLIKTARFDFWFLVGAAIVLRLIFLPAIPNLSQDFYRFIWDGRMLALGYNPYLSTPAQLMASGNAIIEQSQTLFTGMGMLNASHYTNYPPVNQFVFGISGLVAGSSISASVIVLRLVLILSDIGTIIFGGKLLSKLGKPIHYIFFYALNPFIIIELTGNLHFESLMLFFMTWSLYALACKKWISAAILWALAISAKLLPLLFLPLFLHYFIASNQGLKTEKKNNLWQHFSFRESVKKGPQLLLFYLLVITVALLTFAPFISSAFIDNFSTTIGLWFKKFEFNASIYYIIRWVGYQVVGWNIIGTVGTILPKIFIGLLLVIAVFRNNTNLTQLITAMLLSISLYFALSTTVHPWYIATPLLLCVFTRYRFAVVWSFTAVLSYYAYSNAAFVENLWLVAIEYILVFAVFIIEVKTKKVFKPLAF